MGHMVASYAEGLSVFQRIAIVHKSGIELSGLMGDQTCKLCINKEAIEAVVGTEVAQAAINAEFARLINSIKTLQARTYVFNGKDKVSYTDTRTGATSYYVIEWKAHEVVSFKAQG